VCCWFGEEFLTKNHRRTLIFTCLQHLENYINGKTDSSDFIVPDQLPLQETAGAATTTTSRGAAKRKAEDLNAGQQDGEEDDALKTILSNELRLRNRNTMLTIPGRSFDKVMHVLEGVARDELQNAARLNAGTKSVTAPRSSGRFQRQTTTDAAMKQMGADALGIQNVGFGGVQKPQPEQEAQPVVQQPNKLVVPRPMTKAPVPIRPKATPLILVPPAAGAILNMYNIKEFLERGVFVPPEEARARSPQKPTYERCMRIEGRKAPGVKYHITDRDPTKKEDWDRLVAVFCLGKGWQFKKWPFKGASSGDMVETFLKVAGVFFHYADEPIDPLVKKWNVKLIPISRHSRDTDDAAMRAFWQHVDAFLHARHPNVAY
jgi:hypothetical protein